MECVGDYRSRTAQYPCRYSKMRSSTSPYSRAHLPSLSGRTFGPHQASPPTCPLPPRQIHASPCPPPLRTSGPYSISTPTQRLRQPRGIPPRVTSSRPPAQTASSTSGPPLPATTAGKHTTYVPSVGTTQRGSMIFVSARTDCTSLLPQTMVRLWYGAFPKACRYACLQDIRRM